jgi:hypothetical protein
MELTVGCQVLQESGLDGSASKEDVRQFLQSSRFAEMHGVRGNLLQSLQELMRGQSHSPESRRSSRQTHGAQHAPSSSPQHSMVFESASSRVMSSASPEEEAALASDSHSPDSALLRRGPQWNVPETPLDGRLAPTPSPPASVGSFGEHADSARDLAALSGRVMSDQRSAHSAESASPIRVATPGKQSGTPLFSSALGESSSSADLQKWKAVQELLLNQVADAVAYPVGRTSNGDMSIAHPYPYPVPTCGR